MLDIPCVIVAGGKSSRMGRDKALLPFASFETLSEYQIHRLKPHFKSLHVSCKSKDKFDFDSIFIEDTTEFDEYSPLVGLYSILKEFDSPVAILSVDTPFVTAEVFEKLYNSLEETTDVVIARSPYGSHQMCGIYKPNITTKIKEQINQENHKIRALFDKIKVSYVDFESDELFTNLNHPHEYEEAKGKV